MLALTGCILLATSALAVDYAPYTGIQAYKNPRNYAPSGATYPIDYNDDLTIHNSAVKPGSNIFFSFEQIRRDQPPQVELREEDVGRYMYRPKPKPTTTLRTPEMTPVVDDFHVDLPDSSQINRQDRYPEVDTWRQMPVSTTSHRPVVNKFNEFSFEIPSSDQIKPEARYPPVSTWPSKTMPTPPPPPLPKWEDEYSQNYRHQPREQPRAQQRPAPEWSGYQPMQEYAEQTPRFPSRNMDTLPPTPQPQPQPHWTEIEARSTQRSAPRSRTQPQPLRGSHKFSWDDASLGDIPSTPKPAPMRAPVNNHPAAPPQRMSPPSSVPTLSPWSGDNFGK